jgi:hypothetical protein
MNGFKAYNSDIGNWDARINGSNVKQKKVNLQHPDESADTPPAHVMAVARSRGARFIVRTFKYRQHPGSWYVKGDKNTDYDAIEARVISNQTISPFSRRKCWILNKE